MIRRLAPVLLATTALALAGCGGDDSGSGDARGSGVDRGFVAEMIPHHESAVDMAVIAQKRGESDFVKSLANDIVRTQNEEISTMRREDEALDTAGIEKEKFPMSMSMMDMDMDPKMLETADPFDRAFLEMMIPHHESAVEMAKVEIDKGSDPELKALAQEIVDAQEREIAEMKKQLARSAS